MQEGELSLVVYIKNVLKSFWKDVTDGIQHKSTGNVYHNAHPLNEKDILKRPDLACGTIALVDP